MTLDKALEESPALKEMEQNDPKVKELLAVARRLEGMTRHASVHAAGVVIAPKADHRVRAALQGGARRNHDAVVHEGDRARRPAQDGLPRPEHADADRRRDRPRSSARPASELDLDHVPLDDREDLPDLPGRPDLRHLPVREQRACATFCARPSRSASRTSSR